MAKQRIYTASLGPSFWRPFLADPYLHWRRGKSAWELAISWEAAAKTDTGIPVEVESAFNSNRDLSGVKLLLAIPEHRVELDDESRPSQCDLWAVLWTPRGHISLAIEAKAGEEFDKTIEEWLKQESEGKKRRLAFLSKVLGLPNEPPGYIRYQLVHRTAAALIEAKRYHFGSALMLIQSFGESPTTWSDYERFANLLGIEGIRGKITGSKQVGDINLYLGWVDSLMANDAAAASAV
jgi:hypothetical protein